MSRPTPLSESLQQTDLAFTTLLSLIPAKYYIVDTPEEADSKWMKNKTKRSAEEVTRTRKQAKFEKFDPENHKSIPQLQAERSSKEVKESTFPADKALTPMQPSVSISALRQKLQTKIDSFRNKRNIGSVEEAGDGDADMNAAGGNSQDGDGDSDTDNETLASRDDMLEARRKRRGEVRDNRRRKRKAERRLAKEQPVKPSIKASTGSAADGKAVDFKSKTAKTTLLVQPEKDKPAENLNSVESNVAFPSLSLPSTTTSKSHSHIKNISNPTQALAHLQAQKAKLAELPEEKRKEIEEKERWGKMLQRAEGGKIRDDEVRLKKAERRMEKQKAKSGKEWNDRKTQAEQSQAVKAKKRNENIAARSDARKNKKLGLKPKGDKHQKGSSAKKSSFSSGGRQEGKSAKKGRPGF